MNDVLRTALLSEDGRYRYTLNRIWGHPHDLVTWIMLNPSTADANLDDPTIRRCIGFARAWGHGGITVVNIYAYRATKPADLWKAGDPTGPKNDETLRQALDQAARNGTPVIAAWGAHVGEYSGHWVYALAHARGVQLLALGTTKAGQPRHPLYLPKSATPEPWRPNDAHA